MKHSCFAVALLLLLSFQSYAQTVSDKESIYNAVIESLSEKDVPVVNETTTAIYNYDIDGDYTRWFYRKNPDKPSDSLEAVLSFICVIPIKYSQTIFSYLHTKNLSADSASLRSQAKHSKVDSLRKYVRINRFINWEKAPIRSSPVSNLFRKKKVIGISNILFDFRNQLAFVKIQTYSKNRRTSMNPSKIVVLRRIEKAWIIVDTLGQSLPL